MSKGLSVSKSDDFSAWYAEVIQKAQLIEHTDVSGCMIMRPGSYAMWESIQAFLDKEFKSRGVENAYFPLLIPEHLLTKEADHVEGFAPEVAWVTQAGDSDLNERLAIRPTSETVMYDAYRKWVRSHRDLPLKLNQWVNVVRWEFKHPRPFLRTREFLWQEGHTAFATKEEALEEVHDILSVYKQAYEDVLAVPVLAGEKSVAERFAGADMTLSLEALFPDGKAIQACTSHYLGTNFSEAFGIQYMSEDSTNEFVHQNSWGFTTRSIGVMIGVHGDDKGLVLPPRVAPTPVVVVPIVFANKPDVSKKVLDAAKQLCDEHGWRLDDRDGYSPGHKFSEHELKGVPVRIEIGPRDLDQEQVVVARRDTSEKESVPIAEVGSYVEQLLVDIQDSLFARAKKYLEEHIKDVSSVDELKRVVDDGFIARADWCASAESEQRLKESTGAKSLTSAGEPRGTSCFESGEQAVKSYYFGRSY